MSTIIHVPLGKLSLSPRNARKTGAGEVADLAANIAAAGLLQNLIVAPGQCEGEFEVIAGGRRLTALQLLERDGRLPDAIATDGVPCRRIDDDAEIIEASTAENTIRAPLHPADQFEAFQAMVDAGKSIPDVAAHFSLSEVVVRQRLKLANVHPQLVQAYREEQATLEQLQALAVTDDHEAQLQVWTQARDHWERDPRSLRQKLTAREIPSTDARVLFVGLEAYEAAGGILRRDLFSSRDEAFLGDKKLLDRLVAERAAELVAQVRTEGWAWVEFKDHLDYNGLAEFAPHPTEPTYQQPSAADKARIKEIKARLKQIEDLQSKLDEGGDAEDEIDQLGDEYDALEDESQRLGAGTETWPDEVKAVAGALLVLEFNGGVRIHRGRLQPGQKVTSGKVTGATKSAAKTKKPELSDTLVRRLTAHRTLALQATLAVKPDIALKAVVHTLFEGIDRELAYRESASALKISLSQPTLPDTPDLKQAPAKKALQVALKRWRDAGLPTTAAARRTWIFEQDRETLLGLLALAAAFSIDAVHGKDGKRPAADALAADLMLDMAAWWAPDADTYLAAVPKALAIEAVAEACGKDEAATLATLKTAAAAAEAAKKLAGTGWLPKVLRGPGYAVGAKPKAPPSAKTKPAAKKATKRPAKKAPAKKTNTAKKAAKPAATATVKKGAKK